MTDEGLQTRFKAMIADLIIEGEPISLDKVVKRHRQTLQDARQRGLSWASILRLMTKAGALEGSGKRISASHLRASFSRSARTRAAPHDPVPPSRIEGPKSGPSDTEGPARDPPSASLGKGPRRPQQGPSGLSRRLGSGGPRPARDAADLTEQDLDAVRQRLR